MKEYTIPIFKGLLWIILGILFGLLQLWIISAYSYLINEDLLPYQTVFLDGYLLFFVTAIVTSITIDFFLSNLDFSRTTVGLLFVLYPVLIIITSVILFCFMIEKNPADLNLEAIIRIHYGLFIMTCIYAIATKTIQFKQETYG